jgi:hypothetical protein
MLYSTNKGSTICSQAYQVTLFHVSTQNAARSWSSLGSTIGLKQWLLQLDSPIGSFWFHIPLAFFCLLIAAVLHIELDIINSWKAVHLLCSKKELRINAALILFFFLLHLLMQTMFHWNDPWTMEVIGLLTERWDPFNWQNANCFWILNSNLPVLKN